MGNLKKLYRNELDKACFSHDPVYSDSKDLTRRTISDKILKDTAYEITRNRRHDGYQVWPLSFLIRKQDCELV